jgi:hypothetical protein
LDLEGVDCDVVFGDDEPEEASNGDTKYTLEGIQVDIVPTTPVKYNA